MDTTHKPTTFNATTSETISIYGKTFPITNALTEKENTVKNTTTRFIVRDGNPATIIRVTHARGQINHYGSIITATLCEGHDLSNADAAIVEASAEHLVFYNGCTESYCKLEDGTRLCIEAS